MSKSPTKKYQECAEECCKLANQPLWINERYADVEAALTKQEAH